MEVTMVGKVTSNKQLSASQVPVLMGLSKFQSRNELLKLVMDANHGIEPPGISNESMDWGNTLEPIILNEACKRLGLGNPKITHDKPYQHDTLPIACSLDGTIDGNDQEIMTDLEKGIICVNADKIKLSGKIILESKLTAHEVESADQLPLYRGPLQLQVQMDICHAEVGIVCVLYKGTTLRLFVYQRDDETLSEIHDAIMDFQRRIDKYLTNEEVEWYDMQSPDEASRVFDEAEKTTIDLPDVEPLAEQILTLNEEITDKQKQIDALQIRIMDEMRDSQYAHSGRYKISWPVINYKAQPEKYTPPRPARTVRQSKLRIRDREDF